MSELKYPIIYQCKICEREFEEKDCEIFYDENIIKIIDHFKRVHNINLDPQVWGKSK